MARRHIVPVLRAWGLEAAGPGPDGDSGRGLALVRAVLLPAGRRVSYDHLRREPSRRLADLAARIGAVLDEYRPALPEAMAGELLALRADIGAVLDDRQEILDRERDARTIPALARIGGMMLESMDGSRPNAARIYDCLLGGTTSFPADQAAARQVAGLSPAAAAAAKDNRRFLQRAVTAAARLGITQFLDIGSGLPTTDNTHEIARREDWTARVVYVDSDPIAVNQAMLLLGASPQATVINGDLRDPAAILSHHAVRAFLDPARPIAVILTAVLHFIPGPGAREIVGYLKDAVTPGSALVISHATGDYATPGELRTVQAVYQDTDTPLFPRSREQVARFFDGLTLLSPGVVDMNRWRDDAEPAETRTVGYGGVALKPGGEIRESGPRLSPGE